MEKKKLYRPAKDMLPHQLFLMFRHRTALSQRQMAQLLGFSGPRTIQSWEGGYSLPRASRLKQLIELYLLNGAFIRGQEFQEASLVWSTVKNMFDGQVEKFSTYPVFDRNWFETIERNRSSESPDERQRFHENQENYKVSGVQHREFPDQFPFPISSSQLPFSLNQLIGREKEVEEVSNLLRKDNNRLVTLTGPGGSGKTRLALEVARELFSEFDKQVFFVPLAEINDKKLIPSSITLSLGVKEVAGSSLVQTLKAFLRDKKVLVVLDNFEQLIGGGPLLTELIEATRDLRLLVTSRAVLHLYNEQEYAVPPLALPDFRPVPGPGSSGFLRAVTVIEPVKPEPSLVEELGSFAAMQLFVERASLVRPGFKLDYNNAQIVAEICIRLDGLPLAIELAAAHTKLFSPQALLKRLSNRLNFLSWGVNDLPLRQQTLLNTLEWSYKLLEVEEQKLFARLGVFAGDCSWQAVEEVCNLEGQDQNDFARNLANLVDKSLLLHKEGATGEPRFGLLRTLREYALQKLLENGELEILKQRYVAYFLNLAEKAVPHLEGPEGLDWLNRLQEDHNTFQDVIADLLEKLEVERALRLANALEYFWRTRGHFSLGRHWVEKAMAQCSQNPPSPTVLAKAVVNAGGLALRQGDYLKAKAFYEQGLALRQELPGKIDIARILNNLGLLAEAQQDFKAATDNYEAALELSRQLEDQEMVATILNNLGLIFLFKGDFNRGGTLLEECLAICLELNFAWRIANTLFNLGFAAWLQGNFALSVEQVQKSLPIFQEFGDNYSINLCFECLAGVAVSLGKTEEAVTFSSAAWTLREFLGTPLPLSSQAISESTIAKTQALLDRETFERLWASGKALPLEQVVGLALALNPNKSSSLEERVGLEGEISEPPLVSVEHLYMEDFQHHQPKSPVLNSPTLRVLAGLTSREVEVVNLVAAGFNNAKIAEELKISRFTVNTYLRSVYTKMGMKSREEIAKLGSGKN